MTAALVDGALADLEVVTHIGETGSESVHHFRPRSSHLTLCGHTCDDDGAFGDWIPDADAHPEDACGMSGEVCSTCDASYRKARRVASGGPERKPDERPAYKRNGLPKVAPVYVKPRSEPRESIAGSHPASGGAMVAADPPRASSAPDVFRMYRRELEALGTPDAIAELQRRRAKREARRAER